MFRNTFKTTFGELAFHFLKAPNYEQNLIVMIPGGPGLSGDYLKNFLKTLVQSSTWNVALVDLPNHGYSTVSPRLLPLSYKNCVASMKECFKNEVNQFHSLKIIGQSFGARVALDLVACGDTDISQVALLGCPVEFNSSSHLLAQLNSIQFTPQELQLLTEKDYVSYLRKVLPFYFHKNPSPSVVDELIKNSSWLGNEDLLNTVDLTETTKHINALNRTIQIGFFEGEFDKVLPDQNREKMKALFPTAHFEIIPNCGHFPTLENQQSTLFQLSEFLLLS